MKELPSTRPDALDLIGPAYDVEEQGSAASTLLICSAPRAGSYELCRYLTAAGIGVPHEYFNANFAGRLAERWTLGFDPLTPENLSRYIELLRARRSANGVFAAKLMFGQFNRRLRNEQGAKLFDNAVVVHVFRPDVAAQFASFRTAIETGRYDFSPRPTREGRHSPQQGWVERALEDVDHVLEADAGFRRLFIYLGIKPIFVTTEALISEPGGVIAQIADALSVPVNETALKNMIELGKAYPRDSDRAKANAGLADAFRKLAFKA